MSDSTNYFSVARLADEEFLEIQARRLNALKSPADPERGGDPPYLGTEEYYEELKLGLEAPIEERRSIGLALSGGGIRSATFGLGVLQGLADLRLLRFCDYLSTVSGGGYIGSWLAAWIKREGSFDNVETQLRPQRTDQAKAKRGFEDAPAPRVPDGKVCEPEPEPINHLREFGNYLSPRLGVMSADGWSVIAVYLRNLVANQLVILPALLATILVARLIGAFFELNPFSAIGNAVGNGVCVASILMLATGVIFFSRGLFFVRNPSAARSTDPVVGLQCLAATLTLMGFASLLLSWALLPTALPHEPPGSHFLEGRVSYWAWLSGIDRDGEVTLADGCKCDDFTLEDFWDAIEAQGRSSFSFNPWALGAFALF